jgi:hypothetical protein
MFQILVNFLVFSTNYDFLVMTHFVQISEYFLNIAIYMF